MAKKIIIAAAALLIVTFAAWSYLASRKSQNSGAMALSGNVEVLEIDTGFKTPGRVAALMADEGMKVEKGAVIARLESAELEGLAAAATAGMEEAKFRLAELRAGARPQELAQAESGVDYATAELEKARKDYERSKTLFDSGAVSAQRMDEAEKYLELAESGHKRAEEALSLVKAGARKESLSAAERRLKQAEASLAVAMERLNDATLRAPIAGVILKRYSEQGETVAAGSPVFRIGDMENPWVKVYVKESRLGEVKLGQKAEVRVDTYPAKVYEGTVKQISSEAEFTPKNIQTKEERVKMVFGMKVAVKNQNGELKPGMPADVKILTHE
ncbi:MAG: efflux RND transporter periplasmic adaptor subunit [Nitrospinae bacterium]|nr:efflux RND transporter periplasmic adaptor subunit [Nitrospinota bacterium]